MATSYDGETVALADLGLREKDMPLGIGAFWHGAPA